jgi:hypothetical protein
LFYCFCSRILFGFSLKAEARWPTGGQVVPAHVEALPLIPAALAEKRKCGAKALRKTGVQWALRSTSVRGHGQKSVKVVADSTLLGVEIGASDELLLTIRQSFKNG